MKIVPLNIVDLFVLEILMAQVLTDVVLRGGGVVKERALIC